MMRFDLEKLLREARILAGIVLLLVLIHQVIILPHEAGQYIAALVTAGSARVKPILDKITGTVSNVDATTSTVRALADELSADYYDPRKDDQGFYWDIKNVLDRSSESSFATARLVANLDAQLNGGKDPLTGALVQGVIPAATALLNQASELVKDTGVAIGPLKMALEHISGLTEELQAELAKGGNVDTIFERLAISVDDFNKLVENPDIKGILSNVDKTSASLAGSAETLDIVMRPWRKKANQLKVILGKLGGMLHIAVPVPW